MAGYKINSSKSEAFLYTKDKQQAEKEMEMESTGKARKQSKVSWCDSNQTNQSSV